MADALGTLMQIPCANCSATGTMTCSGCSLVKYCSRDCQIAHRKTHKPVCKSPLTKISWEASWVREGRQATFLTSGHQVPEIVGPRKYLCGNTPAFDHLSYADLAGVREPSLLFAASGDLRNVISTLNAYDMGKMGKPEVVLNDFEEYVVVRNLLLLVLLASGAQGAVEAAIHLWYSTNLTPSMAELIGEVCREKLEKMRDTTHRQGADDNALVSTNIQISDAANVRVVWPRKVWKTLFAVLDNNGKIDYSRAAAERTRIALAPHRLDLRDRMLSWIPRHYRLARQKFFDDGQLLPYSQPREPFSTPNFTFFDPSTHEWLHQDFYSPLDGYYIHEAVQSNNALPATQRAPSNDLFGIFYLHLVAVLSTFQKRLQDPLSFLLLCTDAAEIYTFLPRIPTAPQKFDMVDASNLTDHRAPLFGYLGVHGALACIANPLLKPKGVMISSFLNYRKNLEVRQKASGGAKKTIDRHYKEAARAMGEFFGKDLSTKAIMSGEPMGMVVYKLTELSREFIDYKEVWRMYSEEMDNVEDACNQTGMKIKKIEWPYQVKLDGRRDKEEVLREHAMSALNGLSSSTVFVQWVRK